MKKNILLLPIITFGYCSLILGSYGHWGWYADLKSSPLEQSVYDGDNEFLNELLSHNSPGVQSELASKGKELMQNAIDNQRYEIANTLVNAGVKVDDVTLYKIHQQLAKIHQQQKNDRLLAAINLNDQKGALQAIVQGADVNSRDALGNTLLHVAARKGNAIMIDTLTKAGADVNSRDAQGNTPLHIAARKGNASMRVRLEVAGADNTIRNNARQTPADVAQQRDHKKMETSLYTNAVRPAQSGLEDDAAGPAGFARTE